ERFCALLEQFKLPGVYFRRNYFRPTFHKFQNQLCGGAQIHVTDRLAFRPVKTALCILHVLLSEYPQSFTWRQPPYEFVTDRLPVDILFGNSWIRDELERGVEPYQIEEKWRADLEAFLPKRERYLLYE
ncbi:MAG TPA: DUF1343 domain-containing protein, partial [Acidobacteriota bacterium]